MQQKLENKKDEKTNKINKQNFDEFRINNRRYILLKT